MMITRPFLRNTHLHESVFSSAFQRAEKGIFPTPFLSLPLQGEDILLCRSFRRYRTSPGNA